MRASVHTRYGSPDVVQVQEIAKPVPKDDEILIKVVHATTVNRSDCGYRGARPFITRFFTGLTKPRRTVLGGEFSGEVEAAGKDVPLFDVGDQVFGLSGSRFGAHAEYLCLPETGPVATKSANMSHAEAAAVCDGAMIASVGLKKARIQREQTVLVYGAAGSIGSATVQLATQYGARVTGVCGTGNLELVRSLGAEAVIDRTGEDFTKSGQTYDIVFDAVGKSSFARCKGIIKPGGTYVATDLGFLVQVPILMLWTSKFGDKKVVLPTPRASKETIVWFKELIEAGHLRAVIDRTYPLDRIVEAYRYVETGRRTGNVVITVAAA